MNFEGGGLGSRGWDLKLNVQGSGFRVPPPCEASPPAGFPTACGGFGFWVLGYGISVFGFELGDLCVDLVVEG